MKPGYVSQGISFLQDFGLKTIDEYWLSLAAQSQINQVAMGSADDYMTCCPFKV